MKRVSVVVAVVVVVVVVVVVLLLLLLLMWNICQLEEQQRCLLSY